MFKIFSNKKKREKDNFLSQKQVLKQRLNELNETKEELLTNNDKEEKKRIIARLKDIDVAEKHSGFELVHLRYAFYRDGYRSLIKANIILSLILGISVLWNITNTVKYKSIERQYFAVDGSGRIIPVYAASNPLMTQQQLNNWVLQAVMDIYDMTAINYRQVINNRIPKYFTAKGLQQYKEALSKSDRLGELARYKMMMSAVPAGTPVIFANGVAPKSGRYYWRIRLPIRISYQVDGKIASEIRTLTLTVIRVNTQQYPSGVAINQIVESDVLSEKDL